jgi:hypothetical protein
MKDDYYMGEKVLAGIICLVEEGGGGGGGGELLAGGKWVSTVGYFVVDGFLALA